MLGPLPDLKKYSLPEGISLEHIGRAPPSYGDAKFEERRERRVNEWKTKTTELLAQIANRMASSPRSDVASAAGSVYADGVRFIDQTAQNAKTATTDDEVTSFLVQADTRMNETVSKIPSGGRRRKNTRRHRRGRKTRRARK
jgi:hypothetical protein